MLIKSFASVSEVSLTERRLVVGLVDVCLQSFGEWRWTSRSASLCDFWNYLLARRKDV